MAVERASASASSAKAAAFVRSSFTREAPATSRRETTRAQRAGGSRCWRDPRNASKLRDATDRQLHMGACQHTKYLACRAWDNRLQGS